MGLFDFKMPKFKAPKVERLKVARLHMTKVGDRTSTSAQRRKLKEAVGFKCQRCGKKFDGRLLEIHHKKSIASHKNKLTGVDFPVYSLGKKIKPKYDRKSNLEVVCIYCHDKTKKQKKKPKPLWSRY